jgi:ferredoxin
MAGNKTFHCQLITPEAAMVDVRADQVVFTAHDGEVGILLNRAPLLCKLGIGEMRVTTEQGTQHYYVEGGFAHVIEPRPGAYFTITLDACESCGKCVDVCPCGFLEFDTSSNASDGPEVVVRPEQLMDDIPISA